MRASREDCTCLAMVVAQLAHPYTPPTERLSYGGGSTQLANGNPPRSYISMNRTFLAFLPLRGRARRSMGSITK